jgi:hypothetical protein
MENAALKVNERVNEWRGRSWTTLVGLLMGLRGVRQDPLSYAGSAESRALDGPGVEASVRSCFPNTVNNVPLPGM